MTQPHPPGPTNTARHPLAQGSPPPWLGDRGQDSSGVRQECTESKDGPMTHLLCRADTQSRIYT